MPNGLSRDDIREWWLGFNGNFRNFDLPDESGLIAAIKDGYAYTAQHNRYRNSSNFRCGQHVGLDFDTGDDRSSFEGILQDEFIRNYASFLHTTASHTKEHPRARVVFVLDREIYSVKKYSLLTEAFAETYKTNGAADPSCKDPVRIFFGATGCDVLQLGNILTLSKAAEIVIPYKEKQQDLRRHVVKRTNIPGHVDRGFLIDGMVNRILSAPDGMKWHILGKVAREGGGYVGAGYFDEGFVFSKLFQAIAARQTTRDLKVAEERIQWGITVGKTEPLYLEEDLDPIIEKMFA